MTDRSKRVAVGVAVLLLALCMPAGAADEASSREQLEPETVLQQGVDAFNAGELEDAARLLEQARDRGLTGTVLHYNLGVVYFRLARFQDAEGQFSRLLDTPHRALALYNLGLVAQADDREHDALAYFRDAADVTEEEGLRRMARARIGELIGEPAPPESPQSVEGLISLSVGYNDNLSLDPDDEPSMRSDSFSDLMVALRGRPLEQTTDQTLNALEVRGTLYRRHYHSEDDFSSDLGRLGLYWVNEQGNHERRIGVQQSYLRFGGASREWQSTLDLRYRLTNCVGTATNRCELSAQATQVTPYSGFESQRGQRYRATASHQRRQGDWQSRLRYRAEYNDRRDSEFFFLDRERSEVVEVFFNQSPVRHGLSLRGRYLGLGALRPGATLAYRYSDYRDPYQLPEESGRRIDHRYQATLNADWRVSRSFSMTGEGRYTRNESSLERFDYSRYTVQLRLRFRF